MWAVYGAVGVGGAGAGWVMESRNTLNTQKGLNSSSLGLEFENGIATDLFVKFW